MTAALTPADLAAAARRAVARVGASASAEEAAHFAGVALRYLSGALVGLASPADMPPFMAPPDGVEGGRRCAPRHGACGKAWPHSGGHHWKEGPWAGQPAPEVDDG